MNRTVRHTYTARPVLVVMTLTSVNCTAADGKIATKIPRALIAWIQASAAKQLITAVLWVIRAVDRN